MYFFMDFSPWGFWTRYDSRIRYKDGQYKRMLQQVAVIQSDDDGAVLRTFVIFTGITDLKQTNKMVLSIMGLEGEPSYIDIQPVQALVPHKSVLSKREIQVFRLLIDECPSAEIAEIRHQPAHGRPTPQEYFQENGYKFCIAIG
jgi:hypothetical protein